MALSSEFSRSGSEGKSSDSPLQTVDRALQILLSYGEGRTDWGVFELADAFGLNKSSAQRLLAALAARGFLHAAPYTRRYSLGPAMWRMAAVWERSGGLATLAEEVLIPLARATKRTTSFAVPDGFHVRCLAAVDGEFGPIRSHPLIGDLYPAHAGASSRAYFAFLEPRVRSALLHGRPFARFTDLTQVDEAQFEALLESTVRDGWAYSEGEYDTRTRAIAAPVMMRSNPIGSLTVAEPTTAEESELRGCVPLLLQAADDLAALLSRRAPTAPRQDWRRGAAKQNK